MSYFTLLKDINAGKIAPLYVLYGKESYFIEKIKNKIINKLKPLIGDELTSYDLEEAPIQEVIVDAEIVPFLSEKKLIIVYNPTFLLAKQSRLPFTHDMNPLESYLTNPPEYTTLMIIAPYEKLDNRKKITKLLMKQAEVLVSEPVKQYEVKKWITQIGRDYSISFTDDAISIIESELSENLSILHNEIEKFAHFVGKNGQVTKQIALDLISVSSETSALQLVDAVLERNLSKAIKIYKYLEKVNEEPIAMIALLAFQFRIIFQVKLFKAKGYSDREILRELKAHPYVIKLAAQRGRRFSITRLEQIMNKLADTDTMMKQGKMEKSIAFELLHNDLLKT